MARIYRWVESCLHVLFSGSLLYLFPSILDICLTKQDPATGKNDFLYYFFIHPATASSISFLYLCWLSHCSKNTLYLVRRSFFKPSSVVGFTILPALLNLSMISHS